MLTDRPSPAATVPELDEPLVDRGAGPNRVSRLLRRAGLVAAWVLLIGRRVVHALRWPIFVVAAGVAALVALPLGETTADVGPGRVSVEVGWSRHGRTELVVPPLGNVSAGTHDTPLRVTAQVQSIDVESVQSLATTRGAAVQVRRQAESDLGPLVLEMAIRTVLVAALAGAALGAIVPRRKFRSVIVGGVTGVVVSSTLLAGTFVRFQPDAFQEPRFSGALERAPDVLDAVQREFPTLSGLQERVASLSDRLNELYTAAATPADGASPGEVRILHVSDIHLNPLGLELAGQLAERFQVAAIVDTGDLTSFGYPAEAGIGELIEDISVPYYLVPGNHDSLANRLSLDRLDNLTVLDGDVVDVDGVRVLGFADPSFTVDGETTYEENKRRRREQSIEVGTEVWKQQPDVLAVAGLDQAAASVGAVPLVISGDIHERAETVVEGTLMLNVGSTGATGLGSFTVETDLPYEAEVLNFQDGELVALDYVKVVGVTGAFSVERVVYPKE